MATLTFPSLFFCHILMQAPDDGVVRQGESTNAKYFKFEKSSKKGEVKVVDYIGTESTVVVPKMYKGKMGFVS